MAMGRLYYADAKAGVAAEKHVASLVEFPDRTPGPDWDHAHAVDFKEEDLEKAPQDETASFLELPHDAARKKSYTSWGRSYKEWLYRNQSLELMKSPGLGLVSAPGESEREFRVRLQHAAHEHRDQLMEKLRKRYAAKITRLEERIRKAEHAVQREKEQAKHQKLQTVISLGATLLGGLLGRKTVSRTSLGRATTSARGAGRILKEGKDVDRAEENREELEKQLAQLQSEFSSETEELKTNTDPLIEKLETCMIKPRKKDIALCLVALAWAPYWQDRKGRLRAAW